MWLVIFLFVAFLYADMIGDFADDGYYDWIDKHLNDKEK
jgi:hypothetical protein